MGTITAGTFAGFAATNAVMDELLLMKGYGTSAEVEWTEETKTKLLDIVEQRFQDIIALEQRRKSSIGAHTSLSPVAPRSGPGVWNKRSAGSALSEMRIDMTRLNHAKSELEVTALLLRELVNKKAQLRSVFGKILRCATVVLCGVGVYRFCAIVVDVALLFPLGVSQFISSEVEPNVMSSKVATPGIMDQALSWIRTGPTMGPWYPLVMFAVLGGIGNFL